MSRRKPLLRIGGGVVNRNTLNGKGNEKASGLGLLGAYDDVDQEEDESPAAKIKPHGNSLDTKVADFLKEIDELDTEVATKSDSTDAKISWGNWQQCIDEKTQHPYYWNTSTNEVTWILPEEISVQFKTQANTTGQNLVASEENSEPEKSSSASAKQDVKDQSKNKPVKKESQLPDPADIDIDAELDQALEKTSDNDVTIPILDLELELLRQGKLPLSQHEEENLTQALEVKILSLEENEESKRANGTWKEYEKQFQARHQEIESDKIKWREERFPELLKLVPEKKCGEKEEENKGSQGRDKMEMEEKENGSGSDMETSLEEDNIQSTIISSQGPILAGKKMSKSEDSVQSSPNAVKQLSDEETTAKINHLSNEILDKLSYLEISKKTLTDFHVLLIEIQTRMSDWKDKALSSSHLLVKLSEACERLQHYENTATPDNWSCHWDR